MKPKIMSLEEITLSTTEDPLHLAEYDKSLDAELLFVREQLGAIENLGGVSQAYVAGVMPYLPEGVALESFSTSLSKHQYGIVTESLSTGVKLLIAAGAVAALGGVIYILHRLGKSKTPEVNPHGPKIRPAIQTAKKGSGQIRIGLNFKLKNVNIFSDTAETKLGRSPVWKDGELISVADYVANELGNAPISNIDAAILNGHWKYMGSAPDQKQLPEHFAKFHKFLWKIKDNLEKVVAKGENAKESDIDLAEVQRLNKFMTQNPGSFRAWFENNSKTSVPENVGSMAEVSVFIRQWMNSQLDPEQSRKAYYDFVQSDTQVLEQPDPAGLKKGLEYLTTEAETLAKGFEKLGKSLENTQLPKDVSDSVKAMVNGLKDSLSVGMLVHDIVKEEVKAYNRTVFAVGQYVVRYGRECKDVTTALKEIADEKGAQEPSNVQSQEELDKLMQSGDSLKL